MNLEIEYSRVILTPNFLKFLYEKTFRTPFKKLQKNIMMGVYDDHDEDHDDDHDDDDHDDDHDDYEHDHDVEEVDDNHVNDIACAPLPGRQILTSFSS